MNCGYLESALLKILISKAQQKNLTNISLLTYEYDTYWNVMQLPDVVSELEILRKDETKPELLEVIEKIEKSAQVVIKEGSFNYLKLRP